MHFLRNRNSLSRVLCLTGPAGIGKTALQQTIAEQCAALGILASSFFFSYTDPTRNTVACLIATIAYQLGLKNADLRDLIAASVQEDPLIFAKTVTSQLESLVVGPLKRLQSDHDGPLSFPHAILVDGVDECRAQDHGQVLLAIRNIVESIAPIPFRIFVASRPEQVILEALGPGGELQGLAYQVELGEDGNTTKNIRRMLQRRLLELHVSPSAGDLDRVARAASGRYVYAATVVRYVKTPHASPEEKWRAVVAWASAGGGGASPLAPRDPLHVLYGGILSLARESYEQESGKSPGFMLLLMALITAAKPGDILLGFHYGCLARLFGLDEGFVERLAMNIGALVTISTDTDAASSVKFYHKSCQDFLEDSKLSLHLHVTNNDIDEFLVGVYLRCFVKYADEGELSSRFIESTEHVFMIVKILVWQRSDMKKIIWSTALIRTFGFSQRSPSVVYV